MNYPDFYTQVPPITLQDPLSAFLGAFEEGVLEISYLDCVKLAGHSCPTVAGAYLMAQQGIKALYPDTLPQRGSITVQMNHSEIEGVTGVIANVISFIVGASAKGGFKGIQGQFSRASLLSYDVPMQGTVTLIRKDTQQSVTLDYDPSIVAVDSMMKPLMGKSLKGIASKEEQKHFTTLWQQRVKTILLDTSLQNKLINLMVEKV